MQNRTAAQKTELTVTSASHSLADRDGGLVDWFTEIEDDVFGFGDKVTKKPSPVYLVFTLSSVLITSTSLPQK